MAISHKVLFIKAGVYQAIMYASFLICFSLFFLSFLLKTKFSDRILLSFQEVLTRQIMLPITHSISALRSSPRTSTILRNSCSSNSLQPQWVLWSWGPCQSSWRYLVSVSYLFVRHLRFQYSVSKTNRYLFPPLWQNSEDSTSELPFCEFDPASEVDIVSSSFLSLSCYVGFFLADYGCPV